LGNKKSLKRFDKPCPPGQLANLILTKKLMRQIWHRIWSEPVNMGTGVNTKGNDGGPGLSRDDKTLYFSSFRATTGRPAFASGNTALIMELLHSTKNRIRKIYEIGIGDLK
jgi:hypothetical protein